MQIIKFIKAHGLGNDFVIISEDIELSKKQILTICDRRLGLGCDQLIFLLDSKKANRKMVIFNSDGSEAEACGNAARCAAWITMYRIRKKQATIEAKDRIIQAKLEENDMVTMNMGKSDFAWKNIPLSKPIEELSENYFSPLPIPIAVNIGNPHAIFFVDDIKKFNLQELGSKIEQDPYSHQG